MTEVSIDRRAAERPEPFVSTGALVPYVAVADARRALAFYAAAFDAVPRGAPIVMDDGRIGHSEVEIMGSLLMLADEYPELNLAGPAPGAAISVTLHLGVDDVDGIATRAVAAGATLLREPANSPYGRTATLLDPFGHRWMLMDDSTVTLDTVDAVDAVEPIRTGDVAYASLQVPDVVRAATFYASALGWTYIEPGDPRSRRVVGTSVSHGLRDGHEHPTLFLCYAVEDLDATLERVGAAGGTAGPPSHEPHGTVSDCVDDQGLPFALYQIPHDAPPARPAPNGEHHGDLSYLTMVTLDTARARAFYGSVLGWTFEPGRVDDGWATTDVTPMLGLWGRGTGRSTVVPMYRVDDIHAAVARVQAAGGTSTEVEEQPYGLSSECRDDQGTRFYLGQH